MKIEFKEQRTTITEQDIQQRQDIAQSLLDDAIKSEFKFSVTANQYRDSYENITL
jgi:hypothetical protein